MFVIDVQADIISMQHFSRKIRVFAAYTEHIQCWIASYTTLYSNYFSAQLLLQSAQFAMRVAVSSLSAGMS
jgi:hypothetical protein